MEKRLEEERRWFYQTCAILLGFSTSLLPIFVFYILSTTTKLQIHPVFDLLAWWLFYSGASFNFLIYNFINPVFRKKFKSIVDQILRLGGRSDIMEMERGPSTKITFFSRSKSRESQTREKSKRSKEGEELIMKEPVMKWKYKFMHVFVCQIIYFAWNI